MRIQKPSSGADFKPAPEGSKACTLVDIIDLGTVNTKFGDKDMIRLVFQTPDEFELNGDTLNYNVSQRYNATLNEKGNLYKAVTALLGRKLRADDYGTGGFDMEQLIGRGVLLQIVHSDPVGEDKRIFANIAGIMALPSQMLAPEINKSYTRKKDREDDPQEARDKWATDSTTDDVEPPF
jgi:hypothetical protein